MAFKVKLPSTSKIDQIFHGSNLEPHKGEPPQESKPLPLDSTDSKPIIQPATIIDHRNLKIGSKFKQRVLVQWKELPFEEASWED